MTVSLWEFLDERDEWHYFWTGVAVGWTIALGLGFYLASRHIARHE